MLLQKVISSGQPGIDENALRLAQASGLQTGGTCAAHNEIPSDLGISYDIFPTNLLDAYAAQSKANVDNADGTLAIWLNNNVGVKRVIAYARSRQWPFPNMIPKVEKKNQELPSLYKPIFVLCFNTHSAAEEIIAFLQKHDIKTLNVCGVHGLRATNEYMNTVLSSVFEHCAKTKK